jgi:hypothetical protein
MSKEPAAVSPLGRGGGHAHAMWHWIATEEDRRHFYESIVTWVGDVARDVFGPHVAVMGVGAEVGSYDLIGLRLLDDGADLGLEVTDMMILHASPNRLSALTPALRGALVEAKARRDAGLREKART